MSGGSRILCGTVPSRQIDVHIGNINTSTRIVLKNRKTGKRWWEQNKLFMVLEWDKKKKTTLKCSTMKIQLRSLHFYVFFPTNKSWGGSASQMKRKWWLEQDWNSEVNDLQAWWMFLSLNSHSPSFSLFYFFLTGKQRFDLSLKNEGCFIDIFSLFKMQG